MTFNCELLENDTVYDGYFRLNRYRLRHTSFNGGWCLSLIHI